MGIKENFALATAVAVFIAALQTSVPASASSARISVDWRPPAPAEPPAPPVQPPDNDEPSTPEDPSTPPVEPPSPPTDTNIPDRPVATTTLQNGEFASSVMRSLNIKPTRITENGTTTYSIGRTPFSASYLPTHEGPMAHQSDQVISQRILSQSCGLYNDAVRANASESLATTQRYDKAFNADLHQYYLANDFDPSRPTWEGKCHNWAPASMDPEAHLIVATDRIFKNVPFGLGEMRELTTYFWPQTETVFVGKRNYGDEPESEADDLDFMDLYHTLHGFIGRDRAGVVLDVTPTSEVWNQGTHEFQERREKVTGSASVPAAVRAQVPADGNVWRVTLSPTKYVVEGHYAYRGEPHVRTLQWTGFIVTDKYGYPIGSAYDPAASNSDIPDFAWSVTAKQGGRGWTNLKQIMQQGIPVDDVDALCSKIASTAQKLRSGTLSASDKAAAQRLYTSVAPVTDVNKVRSAIRQAAQNAGVDSSELEAAIIPGGVS